MIGGPPSYLAGFKVDEKQIQVGLRNLQSVVEHVPATILEHHILRDENWKEKVTDVFYRAYASEHTVLTAAEFSGNQNRFLEAARKRLFAESPPSKEFEKWMKIADESKKRVRPPI
jgi:predicted metallo-beta-lactamase superfamily hydrolase